jgi:hypothetical protein
MPIKKHKPEQIVALLRQIEVEIANSKSTPQASKQGVSAQPVTAHRRKKTLDALASMSAVEKTTVRDKENGKWRRSAAEVAR